VCRGGEEVAGAAYVRLTGIDQRRPREQPEQSEAQWRGPGPMVRRRIGTTTITWNRRERRTFQARRV
jgi:hypothetical protein